MQTSDIFFSYAREDGDFVLKLAQDLRAASASLWLDQLDILGGQRWDEAIEKALKACEMQIVVLSPDSVTSHNVMDEVSYALDEGKQVIPVLCRECDVPFRLRRVQRIDFSTGYEKGYKRLSATLGLSAKSQPYRRAQPSASVSAGEAVSQETAPVGEVFGSAAGTRKEAAESQPSRAGNPIRDEILKLIFGMMLVGSGVLLVNVGLVEPYEADVYFGFVLGTLGMIIFWLGLLGLKHIRSKS